MIPQERDLLTNLISRLRQSTAPDRDAEADQLITDLVRERPDVPYVLAQTVLIQDYSLHQAQARIAELEQQLVQGRAPQGGGGFLGAIFGSSRPETATPVRPQPAFQQVPTASGPWGNSPAQGSGPQATAQQAFAPPSGQPSFLRSAATTAAGIAGGALLFQGIESLLGGRGAGFGPYGASYGGGVMPQPTLTETTINNYYDTPAPDTRTADFQQPDSGGSDYSNADFSSDGGGFDDGGNFGGTDV